MLFWLLTKAKCKIIQEHCNQFKSGKTSRVWSFHREVFRPWGSTILDNGTRVIRLSVLVWSQVRNSVSQIASCIAQTLDCGVCGQWPTTVGRENIWWQENESVYIPIGQIHAVEKPRKILLELIEVQSGSYLGEDELLLDFQDRYGRVWSGKKWIN